MLYILLLFIGVAHASIFDFLHHQQQQQHQAAQEGGRFHSPLEFEQETVQTACNKYLCPDTSICVDAPKFCPCPYPSSQLRCNLPDGRYLCVSKPAGDFGSKYDDPKSNWKIDAKNDDIRDCGWVNRAWRGLV